MRRFFHDHPVAVFALALLLCATFAHSQNVRWDLGSPGGSGVVTTSGSGLAFLVAEPGVQLNWCNHPANAVPCTNFANTYPSLTSGTPCGNATQVVLQGSSTCQATGDNFGNMGVYTLPNTVCGGATCYDYTLTVNGVSFGPYVWTTGTAAQSPITLQTNTVNNGSQVLLNLLAGTGITLSNTGGATTINASSVGCAAVTNGTIPKSNGSGCVNSPLSDNGTFITSTEPIHVPAGNGSNSFSNQQTAACSGDSSFGTSGFAYGCTTVLSLQSMPSTTSTGNAVGVMGRTGQGGGGNIPLLVGTVGESVGASTVGNSEWGMAAIGGMTNSGGTVPINGGLYATAVNNSGASRTATINQAIDVNTSVSSGDINTTDIGIHVESPTFVGGGAMSAHYGILLEDQAAASGGTNVSPHGVWELGAAPNQFGGTVNGVAGFKQNGTALALACGTTTTCANTATPLAHFVFGTVALSTGSPSTAVVTGISPAFTSTSTYTCTVSNITTPADGLGFARTSASSITITGPNTVTDTVSYVCVGT